MYDTKYECRYYKGDVILPDDKVTSEEADYIRNTLYQEDYLNIFSNITYGKKNTKIRITVKKKKNVGVLFTKALIMTCI